MSTPSFHAIYFIQLPILRWYGHHRCHLLHHSRHFFHPLRRSDSRVAEKNSDSIAIPSSVTITLVSFPYPLYFITFSAKSTITTITTILITIHIKLFLFFPRSGPDSIVIFLRYYGINHDFGVHTRSFTFLCPSRIHLYCRRHVKSWIIINYYSNFSRVK